MMPIKELLNQKPKISLPPVLIIDERTIEGFDLGPVCGCEEKLKFVNEYKPFVPGGKNPYEKIKCDEICFDIFWRNIRTGSKDLVLDAPFVHPTTNSYATTTLHREERKILKPPRYTEDDYAPVEISSLKC